MAEFEDDPLGKYPTRTAKRLKAAVPPSVKRLRLKRFGLSFRGCLLVAVARLAGRWCSWLVCPWRWLVVLWFPLFPSPRAPSQGPAFLQVSPSFFLLGLRLLAPEATSRRDILLRTS